MTGARGDLDRGAADGRPFDASYRYAVRPSSTAAVVLIDDDGPMKPRVEHITYDEMGPRCAVSIDIWRCAVGEPDLGTVSVIPK